ncbi:biotin-protein ligase, partial [Spinellus fusiger]
RMNVLLYSGNGTSANAVLQAHRALKLTLGHAYDIIRVSADTLRNEPWEVGCSMLVMPGGRDLPYCQDLNGDTNARIRRYVTGGGRYLGLCAGAYYASQCIEFQKGTPLEVTGTRELNFYPGMSRGTMYPGFVYNSEQGARVVSVKTPLMKDALKVYYNGGGYFVEPSRYDSVQVLAYYNEEGLSKEDSTAAAVYCSVGQGNAVLMGVHAEYDITTMLESVETTVAQHLVEHEEARKSFLCAIFHKMGLKTPVVLQHNSPPAITPMYLASLSPQGTRFLPDAHHHFHLMSLEEEAVGGSGVWNSPHEEKQETSPVPLALVYPQCTETKTAFSPPLSLTPSFRLQAYFHSLLEKRSQEWGQASWYRFGSTMLYSQVTTSTQTVLDRNYKFAQLLPTGLVFVAANQTAGRGRGSNSWVSQRGALQFSLLIRHPLHLSNAPVVFIQYIIALAVVESIRTRPGYEKVPLRLKWPNDIYAELPQGLLKVGGLLVNSSFVSNEFLLVVGCGINLANHHPTVSVNEVIHSHNPSLAPLHPEDTLAGIMVCFEKMYHEFCEQGMGRWFLDLYYDRWLHSHQRVTLTTHQDTQVHIVGITSDYGLLEAVSADSSQKKRYTLQPDGNSFDMLKGLIIKKE